MRIPAETVPTIGDPVSPMGTSDERDLPNDVTLRQPSNLSLANHVHPLDTLNRTRGRIKGSKSLTRSHPPFDRSVILLHDVVQMAHRAASAMSSEFSNPLAFTNDLRIGRIPIHVDYSWTWVAN